MNHRRPSPVLANLPPACSMLTSAALLYLVHVHGNLIAWWMSLQQEANVDANRYPSFFPVADRVYHLALVLAALNLAVTVALWRWDVAHRLVSGIAAFVSTCTLLICLFIHFF